MRLQIIFACLSVLYLPFAQATSFRYFYDDANELYRVLDSTGTLIEYTYDPSGNITNISRTTIPPNQLSILNVTPSNTIGGSTITIIGQNFDANAAGNAVLIGGVAATVISATATQLVVRVPNTTSGGVVSVTVASVTATWSNTISVLQPPFISSISPASGKRDGTATVTVTGQNLFEATFALQSLDPAGPTTGANITVVSNNGSSASLSLALGGTEGLFALIGTNSVGTSDITPASLFLIGSVNNSAVFTASILNTGIDATTNPLLSKGQNAVSFLASVLNTGFDPAKTPPFPPGQNAVTSIASVLNTGLDATHLALPPGLSAVNFNASVLNTGFNPVTTPPFPKSGNSVSYYASVLNIGIDPFRSSPPPSRRNAVSYVISVCNTNFGCTAKPSAVISTSAPPPSAQPALLPQSSSVRGAVPVLTPLEEITRVTVGQTVRLTAQNVDPRSVVEFNVNRAVIATVREAPYETLFTVPDGVDELLFHIIVRAAGQPERQSQFARIVVNADDGASIYGAVAQPSEPEVLSLAAGGLATEFFRLPHPVTALPSLDGIQPVRSGYVTAINQANPGAIFGDDPLGAHLGSDYAVRFTGELRAEGAGQYRFWLTARSGAAILIDGKLLTDSGLTSGEPAETAVTLELGSGWHSIEVIYYLAVGPSSLRLEWQQPNSGRREVIGPEYLQTELTGITAVSAADGAFAFAPVPKKFDTVWIRVKRGAGLLEFPPLKPAAGPVLIAVPR